MDGFPWVTEGFTGISRTRRSESQGTFPGGVQTALMWTRVHHSQTAQPIPCRTSQLNWPPWGPRIAWGVRCQPTTVFGIPVSLVNPQLLWALRRDSPAAPHSEPGIVPSSTCSSSDRGGLCASPICVFRSTVDTAENRSFPPSAASLRFRPNGSLRCFSLLVTVLTCQSLSLTLEKYVWVPWVVPHRRGPVAPLAASARAPLTVDHVWLNTRVS